MGALRLRVALLALLACCILGCSETDDSLPRISGTAPSGGRQAVDKGDENDVLFSTILRMGALDITERCLAEDHRQVLFHLRVAWNDGNIGVYRLRISLGYGAGDTISGAVSLRSESCELLWEYGFAGTTNNPEDKVVTERTIDDRLVISHKRDDRLVSESYDHDGRRVDFVYSASLAEKASTGRFNELTDRDQSEFISLREAFLEFYDAESSLEGNKYGFLVTYFLSDEAFTAWLAQSPPSGILAERCLKDHPSRLEIICAIAAICSSTKCFIGGIANPLCVACFGTSFACALATVFMWLFYGSDDILPCSEESHLDSSLQKTTVTTEHSEADIVGDKSSGTWRCRDSLPSSLAAAHRQQPGFEPRSSALAPGLENAGMVHTERLPSESGRFRLGSCR
jgi:hypothetical protein